MRSSSAPNRFPRTASEPTAIRPRVAVRSTPTIDSPSTREPTSSATERPARTGRSVHAESRTGGRPARNNATSITASDVNGFITTRYECVCLVVTPSTTAQCAPGSEVHGSAPRPPSFPLARTTQPTAAHPPNSCTSVAAPRARSGTSRDTVS